MGVQIWRAEAIENILWAMQTVIQAAPAETTASRQSSVYYRAFRTGFVLEVERICQEFTRQSQSLKVWPALHIKNSLLSARGEVTAGSDLSLTGWEQPGYTAGLEAACWCVATSFGLSLLPVSHDEVAESPAWFPADIQNILQAIRAVITSADLAFTDTPLATCYKSGFEAALARMAQSLGLQLLVPTKHSSAREIPFWSRHDIESKVQGLYQSGLSLPMRKMAPEERAYWQGFATACHCAAVSFGTKL